MDISGHEAHNTYISWVKMSAEHLKTVRVISNNDIFESWSGLALATAPMIDCLIALLTITNMTCCKKNCLYFFILS